MTPALVLAPDVTTNEPKVPSKTPEPSAISNPGPRKTATAEDPASFFTHTPHSQPLPRSKQTETSLDFDPGKGKSLTSTDEYPAPPEPTAKQPPAQSADPSYSKSLRPGEEAPVHPDPSVPPPAQSADPSPISPEVIDPNLSDHPDAASQRKGLPQTTIQLWPQPNQAPTTIFIGSKSDTEESPTSIGALIVNGFGKLGIPAKPSGASDLKTSIAELTIAGHAITANPTSFQIAGTPVKAGAPAVTVSGTPISLGLSGDLVIGSSVIPNSLHAAIFTVGAQRFTADGTDLVSSDTTVHVGDPAVLVAGTSASLDSSGVLVLGSSTTTLAGLSPSSIYTVGGETFTANPTKFAVAGATLSAGGPGILINSTSISLNPSGSLIIGSSTIRLPNPTPAAITADGQVYTIEPSGMIAINGITLSSGGPGTTIDETPMSVGSGGLIIGTSIIPLQTPPARVVTTDGQVFTIEPSGLIAVGGITLSNGGPGTTISGTPMSVGSDGFVIGTNTIPLTSSTASVITTDGQVVTMEPNGAVDVDGATLSSGGSGITINGVPMSVGAGGFVIGSDTIALPTANASAASGPVVPFQGAASIHASLSRLLVMISGFAMAIAWWNGGDMRGFVLR